MADQPTAAERFMRGILPENPIYRQLLGLCPALAVTGNLKSALTMAGAVLFVAICASIMISSIRNLLKPHLRIVVFTITIATFVTIVDRLLAAYMYDMSKVLGPYIPLIMVNCVIFCRSEVCASQNSIPVAVTDAAGQALGFGVGLASIAIVREILSAGAIFGVSVLPAAWPDWVIMALPPGAFLIFGVLLATVNWFTSRKKLLT